MATESPRPRLLSRLHDALVSQKTGVVCAFTAAALLGLGSFLADRRPDVYEGLAFDDVRFFFHPWRPAHVWFYALCAVLALWAASSLLCTWDTVVARVRGRVLRLSAWGSSLVHLSFVLALAAHLWAGLAAESRMHMVGPVPTEIAGSSYRALDLDQKLWPTGMPREATITLERTRGTETSTLTVGFNHPVLLEGGARELLLGRYGRMVDGAVLRIGGERVTLSPGESHTANGRTVTLEKVHSSARLRTPVAALRITGAPGGRTILRLDPSSTADPAFLDVAYSTVVTLQERHNPSIPLVLVVAGLLSIGVVLAGWERLRRERREPRARDVPTTVNDAK
jgi:hypothetical protein